MKRALALAFGMILSNCALADPVYRSGMPVVLDPGEGGIRSVHKAELALLDAFRIRYRNAGAPRMVLFWNRELSDDFQDRTHRSVRVKETERSGGRVDRRKGDDVPETIEGSHSGEREVVQTETEDREAPESGRYRDIDQAALWRAESGFVAVLQEAGVKLVDRTTIMRLAARQKPEEGSRALETGALVDFADMVLEVRLNDDPAAPSGYGFRVSVQDLRTGQQIASLYSVGVPDSPSDPRVRFRSGPSGFERVSEVMTQDPGAAGRALAHELVARLLSSL